MDVGSVANKSTKEQDSWFRDERSVRGISEIAVATMRLGKKFGMSMLFKTALP